jgi:hypothetical protein
MIQKPQRRAFCAERMALCAVIRCGLTENGRMRYPANVFYCNPSTNEVFASVPQADGRT